MLNAGIGVGMGMAVFTGVRVGVAVRVAVEATAVTDAVGLLSNPRAVIGREALKTAASKKAA